MTFPTNLWRNIDLPFDRIGLYRSRHRVIAPPEFTFGQVSPFSDGGIDGKVIAYGGDFYASLNRKSTLITNSPF